jgi:ABC-type phosphate transport system substrate-binding protein
MTYDWMNASYAGGGGRRGRSWRTGGAITMGRDLLIVLGAIVLAAVVPGASAPATAGEPFVVVVNPSIQGTNVRRADLAAVFLKKALRWGNGSPATPIDQSGTSPMREAFSATVLQMPVAAVLQYWQRQLTTTTSPLRPPIVKSSEAEILAYVAKTPGSVAYVSAGASLPPGVKAIGVID